MKRKILLNLLTTFSFIPLFRSMIETRGTHTPINPRMWFIQKILGFNKAAYWPVHHSSIISYPENIFIGVETSPGYMPGCYIQGMGGIRLGDYTQISSNVGLISKNHDIYDCRKHVNEKFPSIVIGNYCWIGMNSVILPGVELGNFTIVGAGSIVTKPFPEGYCILAGNPARIIKRIDKGKCVIYSSEYEYHGYIKGTEMEGFRERNLML